MKIYNGEIKYKERTYKVVFNLNVMEKIQDEYGTVNKWGELTDGTKGEPNAKAVLFGMTEMLNEGIDMENEENGTEEKLLTKKQVGRMMTEIGIENATAVLNDTVINSTKDETAKNE